MRSADHRQRAAPRARAAELASSEHRITVLGASFHRTFSLTRARYSWQPFDLNRACLVYIFHVQKPRSQHPRVIRTVAKFAERFVAASRPAYTLAKDIVASRLSVRPQPRAKGAPWLPAAAAARLRTGLRAARCLQSPAARPLGRRPTWRASATARRTTRPRGRRPQRSAPRSVRHIPGDVLSRGRLPANTRMRSRSSAAAVARVLRHAAPCRAVARCAG